MSKNKNIIVNQINLKGKTILEQFNNFFVDGKTTNKDIIRFLSAKNAQFLSILTKEDVLQAIKDDLTEFYEYFMDEFGEITYDDRMSNWGQEPLIFRAAMTFINEENEKLVNDAYNKFSIKIKNEVDELIKFLMSFRCDKIFSICNDYLGDVFHFPGTVKKSELPLLRNEIKNLVVLCADSDNAAITVRLLKKNHQELFIISMALGVWKIVSKEDAINAHTLTPSGKRIAPEEGLEYLELTRPESKIVPFSK